MSKEIKVALFIIGSILIAVIGSNFLLSKGVFSSSNTYYVVFESTEGLYKSNLIVINGMKIGKVSDLTLIKEGKDEDKILVTLDIADDIKIPVGSKAILGSEGTGLMGDMLVKIHKNKKSNEFLEDGAYLERGVEVGLIDDLTGKFGPVGDNLNVTLENINKLFDFEKQNNQSLNYTIENLNTILATYNRTGNALNSKIASLGKTLDNLESFTKSLDNKSESLGRTLDNVETLTNNFKDVEIKETLKNLEEATNSLNSVLAKVNNENNTVGALLNDKKVYNDLDKAIVNLNLLLKDLRLHPKRYVSISVFGKKDKTGPIMSDDE